MGGYTDFIDLKMRKRQARAHTYIYLYIHIYFYLFIELDWDGFLEKEGSVNLIEVIMTK